MAFLEIENFCFTYPLEHKKALSNIDLRVEQGDFILICGDSASGKTTLLRNLKREISPVGEKKGEIRYKGIKLENIEDTSSAKEIGFVFQEPENQILMDTVLHELAFSLENFGYSSFEIKKRIGEMSSFFGLGDYLDNPIRELSGGQKQLINLCSVLLLRPELLLLDEPTAQLDPVMANDFIKMIFQLNQEFSLTVMMSEHRMDLVFPYADRVLWMHEGEIQFSFQPKEMQNSLLPCSHYHFQKFLPTVTQMFIKMNHKNEFQHIFKIPLTVREGRKAFEKLVDQISIRERESLTLVNAKKTSRKEKDSILFCDEMSFQYARKKNYIIKELSLKIREGEVLTILGGNGAGKSTFLQLLAGILYPQEGRVYYKGERIDKLAPRERVKKIGYVAQTPLLHFTKDTILDELTDVSRKFGDDLGDKSLGEIIQLFHFDEILKKHPYDISGGQQQKLAIALALIPNPNFLILDEPTKGMDPLGREKFGEFLQGLKEKGKTIVMASHDIEFAAKYANRCGLLSRGEITELKEPKLFFSSNYFYTTTVHRVVRDFLPFVVIGEEVLKTWEFQNK
jgi:energy-coupling factor transport system ATP-binding protein